MIWNMFSQNMNGKSNMRKRTGRAVLVAVLAVALLTGCAGGTVKTEPTDRDRLNVVTTIFPQYDFVRQIAGGNVSLKMLLKPGEETHSYEPTPQDIIAIQKADLFIYVGGENDEWVEDILDSPEMEHVRRIRLVDCVDTTLEEEHKEGMQEERGHKHPDEEYKEGLKEESGDAHPDDEYTSAQDTNESADRHVSTHTAGETEEEHNEHVHTMDEHVWTSPENAVEIVDKITETLCGLDSEHAVEYRTNQKAYDSRLEELDGEYRRTVAQANRHTLLFGDRFPFRYFVAEYGLDYYAAFSGCASDTEPSAATMAFLINKVREEQIPVVLKMELSNDNIAKAIAEATGAEVRVFYSSHNISAEQFEAGVTYLDLMKKNVETLKEALR